METFKQKSAASKLRMPAELHLQVCDVIHDGPAFDRMTLRVDEVIVDLNTQKRGIKAASESAMAVNEHSRTLWKTKDADLVKASAAISQWILKTLYLQGQGYSLYSEKLTNPSANR